MKCKRTLKIKVEKAMLQIGGLALTNTSRKSFSKGDTTHWSYRFRTIAKKTEQTIPYY